MAANEPASDNAALDIHAVDPSRLRAEVKKDLGMIAKDQKKNRRSK